MSQFNYDDLVGKIKSKNIDENLALTLGKYCEFYDFPVRHAIGVGELWLTNDNYTDNRDFFGIRNRFVTKDKSSGFKEYKSDLDPSKLIRTAWLNSEYLRCIDSSSKFNDPTHFIYNFKEYLSRFCIKSVKDILDIYNASCIFLKKYIDYKGTSYKNIEGLCKFLIFDVLSPVFSACKTLYAVWMDTEADFIYGSLFRVVSNLINILDSYYDNELSKELIYTLYSFYQRYRLNTDYLSNFGAGRDPFLALYLDGENEYYKDEKEKTIREYLNYLKVGVLKESSLTITGSEYLENSNDLAVSSNEFSGESKNDIVVFGNSSLVDNLTSNSGIDALKMDLLKFNEDLVKRYLDKGESVRVNFLIEDQLKMYLQAELNCKMLVANIRKNDESNMLTVLQYEDDNFVLFTVSDDTDTLYGLSINEDYLTDERKLISIDRDEDLTFQFVINLDEE